MPPPVAGSGLLGHATFLYDDLTVAENVDFWSRAAGATVADGRAALDRLGVDDRLHDLPVQALSAGQRRRVSFAAMVCRRPELWLLDEPHAGLDARRSRPDRRADARRGGGRGHGAVRVATSWTGRTTWPTRTVTITGGVVEEGTDVIRDAWLVLVKDLRLERRSKVGIAQVLPFALLVLMLFAFALDPDRGVLERATPGLFWVAVLFSAVLTLQRSFGVEADDGVLDALRLSGLEPAGDLPRQGRCARRCSCWCSRWCWRSAWRSFYGTVFHGVGAAGRPSRCSRPLGIAASGSLYGVLAAGLRSRDTLLPLLLLPVLAPVLISATRAFETGLERQAAGGWSWAALLGVFALAYLSLGAFLFRPLLEDA